jgi:hypothetical protein
MRIFLFGQREIIRLVGEVGRVPSLEPHHREERAAVVIREI